MGALTEPRAGGVNKSERPEMGPSAHGLCWEGGNRRIKGELMQKAECAQLPGACEWVDQKYQKGQKGQKGPDVTWVRGGGSWPS